MSNEVATPSGMKMIIRDRFDGEPLYVRRVSEKMPTWYVNMLATKLRVDITVSR